MLRCFSEGELVTGDHLWRNKPGDGISGLVNICHLHLQYDFATNNWKQELAPNIDACITALKRYPAGLRGVRFDWLMAYQTESMWWGFTDPPANTAKRYSPTPDWSAIARSGIDVTIPKSQVRMFGDRLRAERLGIDLAYVDHEGTLGGVALERRDIIATAIGRCFANDAVAVRESGTGILSVLSMLGKPKRPVVANFCYVASDQSIACRGDWGGNYPNVADLMGPSGIGGSCPPAYFAPSDRAKRLAATMVRPMHWLWVAFVEAVNAVRSCVKRGFAPCVPWLGAPNHNHEDPLVWPAVEYLQLEFIRHCVAAGVDTFGLANYMIPDERRAGMEEQIAQTLKQAERLSRVDRRALRAQTLGTEVQTGTYITEYADFAALLPGGTNGK